MPTNHWIGGSTGRITIICDMGKVSVISSHVISLTASCRKEKIRSTFENVSNALPSHLHETSFDRY